MMETAGADVDRSRSRPLTLADAMVFIVAIGLGLAIARPAIVMIIDAVRGDPRWRLQTMPGAVSLGRMLNIVLLNFLLFLLPAFLIVRLKRPRASLRAMICQPGFAACAPPAAIFIASLPVTLFPPSGVAEQVITIASQVLVICAAPLAWVILIATRRWNPEPSWIDRLGRILGVLWMACLPAHLVLIRLPY
jgi:hypothetical protein